MDTKYSQFSWYVSYISPAPGQWYKLDLRFAPQRMHRRGEPILSLSNPEVNPVGAKVVEDKGSVTLQA